MGTGGIAIDGRQSVILVGGQRFRVEMIHPAH
jgi:hypothetical protein